MLSSELFELIWRSIQHNLADAIAVTSLISVLQMLFSKENLETIDDLSQTYDLSMTSWSTQKIWPS